MGTMCAILLKGKICLVEFFRQKLDSSVFEWYRPAFAQCNCIIEMIFFLALIGKGVPVVTQYQFRALT